MMARYTTLEEQVRRLNELALNDNSMTNQPYPPKNAGDVDIEGDEPIILGVKWLLKNGRFPESCATFMCERLGYAPTEHEMDWNIHAQMTADFKSGATPEEVVDKWENIVRSGIEETTNTQNTSTAGQYITNETETSDDEDDDYNDWLMEMTRINKFLITR